MPVSFAFEMLRSAMRSGGRVPVIRSLAEPEVEIVANPLTSPALRALSAPSVFAKAEALDIN
jgi:hypothetical protein